MTTGTSEPSRRARGEAHAALRGMTRLDHELVDAAYAKFDLSTLEGYRGFICAHARILPALETALKPGELLEDWVGRTAALLADLDALQLAIPQAEPFNSPTTTGARWGAF